MFFLWSFVRQWAKWKSSAMSLHKPAGMLADRFAAKASNAEWSMNISFLFVRLLLNRNHGWGIRSLPRSQAVLSTVKRSIKSFLFKLSMMLIAFLNIRGTLAVVILRSRASLVLQLLVQYWIKQVLPCVWVHWTHTKWYHASLTCFFLIVLQLLQFQITLSLPSFANFISSLSKSFPQNKGHLTYNCDELAVIVLACAAMFWWGSGSGRSQFAQSLQLLTCRCKQYLCNGPWPHGAVHASGAMHSRPHS